MQGTFVLSSTVEDAPKCLCRVVDIYLLKILVTTGEKMLPYTGITEIQPFLLKRWLVPFDYGEALIFAFPFLTLFPPFWLKYCVLNPCVMNCTCVFILCELMTLYFDYNFSHSVQFQIVVKKKNKSGKKRVRSPQIFQGWLLRAPDYWTTSAKLWIWEKTESPSCIVTSPITHKNDTEC